jgi:TPR repeat protein
LEEYETAASKGDAKAQAVLGSLYIRGNVVKQDCEDFDFPELEKTTDILNYCGFGSLEIGYPKHRISYVIQGEGDWGEYFEVIIKDSIPVYAGAEYSYEDWS